MTAATASAPIHDVVQAVLDADAALAASDEAARDAARLATAKPATRRELKAAADAARTELEARRLVALEAYALQINEVYLATEAVADAHSAHATACEDAFKARRQLAKLRTEIETLHGIAVARETYDTHSTPANRQALIDAQARVDQAMADLPPMPAPFAHRFASRLPGVAAKLKGEAESIRLPV